MGGASVTLATRNDIAISSQFLMNHQTASGAIKHINERQRHGIKMPSNGLSQWKKNLFSVTNSLIDVGISFVYRRRYFLWKKEAFESTILYVPVHQTDHHPQYE